MTETQTQTKSAPVLRDISLNLQVRGWDYKLKNVVPVSPPREATVETASILRECLPGKTVEYVHRPRLSDVVKPGRKVNTSSLFFQSVHECFSWHYPLALRPEVLWNLILNEVATCVRQNPAFYRNQFTTAAEGQTRIDIVANDLVYGSPANDWGSVIGQFEEQLTRLVPGDTMEQMLPKFSTDSPESRTTGMVAFMAAASPFYDYRTHTMCGIPEIRLLGEAEDYARLVTQAGVMAEKFSAHLGLYFKHLIPVLKTLAGQAAGDPLDESFWKSLYHYESQSGTDRMNGWVTAFVNYTMGSVGEIQQKSEKSYDWTKTDYGSGIPHNSVPSQVAACPFKWHYLEGMGFTHSGVHDMLFVGGVLGVDVVDGYVTPLCSYGVMHA